MEREEEREKKTRALLKDFRARRWADSGAGAASDDEGPSFEDSPQPYYDNGFVDDDWNADWMHAARDAGEAASDAHETGEASGAAGAAGAAADADDLVIIDD